MLTQLCRATPRPLILACLLALLAALFVVRFPAVPGASMGSYVSTFLIALPSTVALFRYLGPRRAILSLLALAAFAYAIESIGVATGFPYGSFFYGDALGPTVAFGLTKTLLNQSPLMRFEDMIELEAYAVAIATSTADHAEGIAAFLEKRPAVFGKA